MGIRFDLSSTNVMAYVISPGETEVPRMTRAHLRSFLDALSYDASFRVISSAREWVGTVQDMAREGLEILSARTQSLENYEFLDEDIIVEVLAPLTVALGSYDLYILPVGSYRDRETLNAFGEEVARLPGYGILVLIPDFYDPEENIHVLDPSPAIGEVIKNRASWPGAVFMMRTGEKSFAPIDEARRRIHLLFDEMRSPLHNLEVIRQLALQPSRAENFADGVKPTKLLHLSDLHLGTQRAADVQMYVYTQLAHHVKDVSQIVITGDLFDQPRRRHAQQYKNFADHLQHLSKKTPIIVPGNHDQRIFGNSVLAFGRKLRELADLRWQEVEIDEQAEMIFLCFDSSRTGSLARGKIGRDQLISVGTRFDIENRDGKYDQFLKIALLHHHPYKYQQNELPIIDPRGWVGRESFLELEDSDDFLSWCVARGVGLVLHGHKHIPRLIIDDTIHDVHGDRTSSVLTTIGCGSTLGANGTYMSFNLIQWDPALRSWTVEFMIDRGDASGFRPAAVESQGLRG